MEKDWVVKDFIVSEKYNVILYIKHKMIYSRTEFETQQKSVVCK